MFRTFIWFVYFWWYQLKVLGKLKRADALLEAGQLEERDALVVPEVSRWAKALLKVAGVTVSVEGKEVDETQTVVYVSNHQGNFDIPILLAHLKGKKGFVAKDSLEKMPLVSRWMKHIHCVFMNRENVREAAVAINEGIKTLKSGYSMVIFPEGTRSLDGNLLEFKAGALKLATKPKVTIVPVSIDGSLQIMPKGSWAIKPSHVTVTLHEPIPAQVYEAMDTTALTEHIMTIIKKGIHA